ncbi:MAG: RtcB family protein [Bacteroidetes bacterium]|nr:RtcB family protein [Bacteroidota bacterium]
MKKIENNIVPYNGYGMLVLLLGIIAVIIGGLIITKSPFIIILIVVAVVMVKGFFIVNPNGSKVLVLFGAYMGTVRENGFFWANPFYTRQRISLRARNFDSETVKVNDKIGNPVMINVILVWKVEDTFKAAFDVDEGVISPGGVGYDINCGVRLLGSELNKNEILPKMKDLVAALFSKIPSGVGAKGPLRVPVRGGRVAA